MKLVKTLATNFEFNDERGSLIQLVREGFKQVNVIFSHKGALRGTHYHENNKEAFYIINGQISLEVWHKDSPTVSNIFYFKKGDFFEIEPYVVHNFNFETDTLLISMYDNGVELPNGEKDIITI